MVHPVVTLAESEHVTVDTPLGPIMVKFVGGEIKIVKPHDLIQTNKNWVRDAVFFTLPGL